MIAKRGNRGLLGQGRKPVRRDVQELFTTGDMSRLAAEVAQDLTNRDVRSVHQDRAHGGSQRSDRFQKAQPGHSVGPRADHDEVEVLDSTLPYRSGRVRGSTDIDAFRVCEVCDRPEMPGIEIDDEQTKRCVQYPPGIACSKDSSTPRFRRGVRGTASRQFCSRAFLVTLLVHSARLPARSLITVSMTGIQFWFRRNRTLRSTRFVPCSGRRSLAQ